MKKRERRTRCASKRTLRRRTNTSTKIGCAGWARGPRKKEAMPQGERGAKNTSRDIVSTAGHGDTGSANAGRRMPRWQERAVAGTHRREQKTVGGDKKGQEQPVLPGGTPILKEKAKAHGSPIKCPGSPEMDLGAREAKALMAWRMTGVDRTICRTTPARKTRPYFGRKLRPTHGRSQTKEDLHTETLKDRDGIYRSDWGGGRFAALGGSQDHDDLDIPLPRMMFQEEGDLPRNNVTVAKEVVPKYSNHNYSINTRATKFRTESE